MAVTTVVAVGIIDVVAISVFAKVIMNKFHFN